MAIADLAGDGRFPNTKGRNAHRHAVQFQPLGTAGARCRSGASGGPQGDMPSGSQTSIECHQENRPATRRRSIGLDLADRHPAVALLALVKVDVRTAPRGPPDARTSAVDTSLRGISVLRALALLHKEFIVALATTVSHEEIPFELLWSDPLCPDEMPPPAPAVRTRPRVPSRHPLEFSMLLTRGHDRYSHPTLDVAYDPRSGTHIESGEPS